MTSTRLKLACAFAGAIPFLLLAYSTGAPTKHTGGVDGGADCTSCHNTGGAANSDSRGSVVIQGLQPYTGSPQQLRVTVTHPLAERAGFQLTARFVTGNGTLNAGTFEPSDNNSKVVCDDGSTSGPGLPGPCTVQQLEWIENATAAAAPPGTGLVTFNILWRPPSEENGAVVFYVSALAAWGTGSAVSERVYDTTARVELSPTAQCGITKPPVPRSAVNAGPHAGPFAPNSMVEIYGSSFQASSRMRSVGIGDLGPDGNTFPTQLSCIAVEIGGKRAPVVYVQQDQINIQAPNLGAGPFDLVVIANPGRPNELRSVTLPVVLQTPAPSFFTFGATKSVAALFGNSSQAVAQPSIVAGGSPAKPGDIITLWGTGFGPTDPAYDAGQMVTGAANVAGMVTVTIGGQNAPLLYAGLSAQSISGLYQVNIQVPSGIADGDQPVVATVNGAQTQTGVTIPIQH